MAEIFTVETRGIGKPDYSKEVAQGQVRPGISLKYNQALAFFAYVPTSLVPHPYPVSWVQPVLAPGAIAHLIDGNTGFPLPFLLPAGYIITLIESTWNFDQDSIMVLYMDGALVGIPGVTVSGLPQHVANIAGYSSTLVDPTASSPHLIDYQIINRGGADMSGGMEALIVLEKVGSPPWPTDKTTRCPFCLANNVVPVAQTVIVCNTCRKTYIVRAPSEIRKV